MNFQHYDFQPIRLQNCTVLGGCGFAVDAGESIDLLFEPGKMSFLFEHAESESVLYPEIVDLRIDGPGRVTSGGGFVGGGFGVESALEGIAVASVLNLLTTKSKVHTYIAVTALRGELHLHFSGMEPAALEIGLSPVLTSLRRLEANWVQRQLERLEKIRAAGIITDGELDRLRQNVLAPPSHRELAAQTKTRQQRQAAAKEAQTAAKEQAIQEARRAEIAQTRELEEAGRRATPGRLVDITFFGRKL